MIVTYMISKMKARCYICYKNNKVDTDTMTFTCKHCANTNHVKINTSKLVDGEY